jgi:hypothetical protein
MQVNLAIVKQPKVVVSIETHKMGYLYVTSSEHPILGPQVQPGAVTPGEFTYMKNQTILLKAVLEI